MVSNSLEKGWDRLQDLTYPLRGVQPFHKPLLLLCEV